MDEGIVDYMVDTNTEKAYLAGVVDGEGSICLALKKAGNLSFRLQIANTDLRLMDWLTTYVGGHSYRVERKYASRHKPCYQWMVSGDEASAILVAILPYLHLKAEQAGLAIRAWDVRQPTPISDRRQPTNPGILEMRGEHVEQMHALNRKGP